jgi:hypothetical protein
MKHYPRRDVAVAIALAGVALLGGGGALLGAGAATDALTLTPEADAYVTQVAPDQNFGANIRFRVDGAQDTRTYMRFRVPDLGGRTVTDARLRIYATSSARVGYAVQGSDDHAWSERAITYANAPALPASASLPSGPFTADTWTSVDVTSAVVGPGVLDFVLTEGHITAIAFASRETGTTSPQLVITTTNRKLLALPHVPRDR